MLSRLLREFRGLINPAKPGTRFAAEIARMVETNRIEDAEHALRRRLVDFPDDADAAQLLGTVYYHAGRHEEAIEFIGNALRRYPDAAFLHANLAEVLRASGKPSRAERHAREAVRLAPESAEFVRDFANILFMNGQIQTALEVATRAVALAPGDGRALRLLGTLQERSGMPEQASECFRRVLELEPGSVSARVQRFRSQADACDWSYDADGLVELLRSWAAAPTNPEFRGINPFIAWHVDVPESTRAAVTQSFADSILESARKRGAVRGFAFDRTRAARLRVGYLSADFHNHPTMHLMRSMFAAHDRSRVESYAYSLGKDDGSEYRRIVMRDVDHFTDLRDTSSEEIAARIHGDSIDILVDLKGYTLDACPEVLALHPSPVQVTWLGYPASIGAGLADYAIVDRVVAPPESARYYGERLVWMPHSYQVNDSGQDIALPLPGRLELGLPESGFVFACHANSYKIEPRIFAAWMRILARVPGSVLWLFRSSVVAERNLRREAQARGIGASRLIFAGPVPKPLHLARLSRADLVLDTHFINSHTGASDALWAGVPLLTLPGSGFASRVAASVLHAAGLPQLVCRDLSQYEALAVQLAEGGEALRHCREHLREHRARMPLFDTARFVRNLERAYWAMHEAYVRGEAPRSFAVEEEAGR